jgi:hypothetical protein
MSGITIFSASAANGALTFSWDVCANLINKDNIKSIILHLNDFAHEIGSGAISSYTLPSSTVTDLNTGNVTDIVKTFTVTTYNGVPLQNGILHGAAIYIQLKNGTSHYKALEAPIKPLSVPDTPIFEAVASEGAISFKLINYTNPITGASLNGEGVTGFEPLTKVFIYLSNNTAKTFQIVEIDDVEGAFGENLDQYYKIEDLENANDYEVSISSENSLGMSPMSITLIRTPSDLPGMINDKIALPTIVYDESNVLSATVLFGDADDQVSLLSTDKPITSYIVYRYTVNLLDQPVENTKTTVATIITDASGLSVTKDASGVIITYTYDSVDYPFKVTDATVVAGTKYIYGIAGINTNGEGVINYTNVMRAGKLAEPPTLTLTPTDEDVLATAVRPINMGGFLPIVSVDGSGVSHYLFRYMWSYLDASGEKQIVATVDSSASSVSSGETLENGKIYTVEAQLITEYETVRYYGLPVSKTSVPYGDAAAPENFTLSAVDEEGPLNGALYASWDEVTDKNGSTGALTYSILVEDGSSVMQVVASGIVTTTYTLTGLVNGTTYTITVRADVYNTEIMSSVPGTQSEQEEATPFKLPSAASNLRFTRPSDASLVFIFDACSNETGLGGSAERYKINVYELVTDGVYSDVSAEYVLDGAGVKSLTYSGVNGNSYEFILVTGVYDGTNIYYNTTSQSRKATMYGTPDAPESFAIQPLAGGFRATWDAPINLKGTKLEGYRIISDEINTVVSLSKDVEYYIATGFTNGQVYPITIKTIASALYETNEILSEVAGPINTTPGAGPATPQNLVATGANSKVTLSWTRAAGVSGYQVSLNDNPTYTRLISAGNGDGWTFGVSTISFEAGSLTNGTVYKFKVSAFNVISGNKYYSASEAEIEAVPFAEPGPPQSLNCSVLSNTIISSWSAPTITAGAGLAGNSAIKYRLTIDASYTDASGLPVTTQVLNKFDITTTSETFSSAVSLVNGKLYLVRVYAYFTGSDGITNYVSSPAGPALVIPNPPPQDVSGLTIVPGNNQNVLSWVNPTDTSVNLYPRTKIEIYRRVDSTTGTGSAYGAETKIADLSANITTYTDSLLLNGALYRYKVVSLHSSNAQQPAGAVVTGMPFGKAILVSATIVPDPLVTKYNLLLNKNGSNLLDYVAIGALPDGSGNVSIPIIQGTVPANVTYGGLTDNATYAANQFYTLPLNMGVKVNAILAIIENGAGFITKTVPTGTNTTFGQL